MSSPLWGWWPWTTPLMGLIVVLLACLCAAGCVRSLHRGASRPLRSLTMALGSFALMLGCLHDALLLLEPLLP